MRRHIEDVNTCCPLYNSLWKLTNIKTTVLRKHVKCLLIKLECVYKYTKNIFRVGLTI